MMVIRRLIINFQFFSDDWPTRARVDFYEANSSFLDKTCLFVNWLYILSYSKSDFKNFYSTFV